MILDILKNKIAAVAVTWQTLVPPPEEDVYRVSFSLIADGDRSDSVTNALCDMRIGATRECKFKTADRSSLYIRGDARNPRGFSVGKVMPGDVFTHRPVSEQLTHVLIEDLEAGVKLENSMSNEGWYHLLTMRRLTAEEVAELDRPRVAVAGSGE